MLQNSKFRAHDTGRTDGSTMFGGRPVYQLLVECIAFFKDHAYSWVFGGCFSNIFNTVRLQLILFRKKSQTY